MTLSIEIKGADEVTKRFKKLGEEDLKKATEKWLNEASILLVWEAKRLAPVNNGMLRKSINYKVYPSYAEIFTKLFYAPFVHEWTAPHIIMPKFKKALHWIDPTSWENRFAKLVHHPWYKGNPFFATAVKNQKSRILNRFYEIINEYTHD